MKVVLRHKATGRYYQSPGKWVRRADNALTFEGVDAARRYSRSHRIEETQAVLRLAPYLMPLLHSRKPAVWNGWLRARSSQWYWERANKFGRN